MKVEIKKDKALCRVEVIDDTWSMTMYENGRLVKNITAPANGMQSEGMKASALHYLKSYIANKRPAKPIPQDLWDMEWICPGGKVCSPDRPDFWSKE